MKKLILLWLLLINPALADNVGFQLTGPITPSNCVKIVNRTIGQDAGTTCGGSSVIPSALTRTNDTNVTLTLSGAPNVALLSPSNLALGWAGQLGLIRGGTASDLSATGGSGQFLKQSTVGGNITVGTISSSDLPGTFSGFAIPTVTVGITPSAGVLTTALRSDAKLALDQTAAYAFSGLGLTAISAAGSATTPALSLTNFETGTGFYVTAAAKIGLSVSGTLRFDYGITRAAQWNFSNNVFMTSNLSLVGAGSVLTVTNALLTGPTAGVLQLGAANAASPVAQTLQVQSVAAGNANTAGVNWIHQGSLSNGSGLGGLMLFNISNSNAASGTQNTATTRFSIGPSGGKYPVVTVANLPTCDATNEGSNYGVSDALAPSFLVTIVGGGAIHTSVYCNSSTWVAN